MTRGSLFRKQTVTILCDFVPFRYLFVPFAPFLSFFVPFVPFSHPFFAQKQSFTAETAENAESIQPLIDTVFLRRARRFAPCASAILRQAPDSAVAILLNKIRKSIEKLTFCEIFRI